jgi:hypothetical protein
MGWISSVFEAATAALASVGASGSDRATAGAGPVVLTAWLSGSR